ncbi:MAG: 50S ribosomal protein L23 [Cyanobacteria bacterium REEB459]|nr:50S ribosomal protein L23 [Cyanobacteria bacterium REEB459]
MTKVLIPTLADLIRRPLLTEKATMLLENNQYVFEVVPDANKLQIKAAIEELFDVKVVAVNTFNPPKKKRRMGRFVGHRAHYKRAVVTLAAGDSIPLFPDL